MPVRVEKNGSVTTVIIDRLEARNAVNPETADALKNEGIAGAGRFVTGLGRHGDFSKI